MLPMKKLLLAVMLMATLSAAAPYEDVEESTCGYESCHPVKDGFINVHIVPHTHDDVGWLKTVDQYYYGSKPNIQQAGVQYILDSVVSELRKDPKRRFIYVETAFLWKWWRKQHDVVKHQFKKFIRSGQLEIIGGAWSMNDEATTHYQSIIDQFTWGLRKLNETFGHCGRPKIGWQIDPFGHSREMASIFSQLGFDGLLLGRIDYQDKQFRFGTKTPEIVWQSSENLGNSSQLFTSVMYNTYSPPPGFCFDIYCYDEPIIDDRKSPDYNVDRRWGQFVNYIRGQAATYVTNNLIITMGGDFHYQGAHTWFSNLDKLISYANQLQVNGSKYNLIYSTPSCYLKAVHDEAQKNNLKFLVKTDDFFPYASDGHAYWTGYFTSKPTIKRFERLGNNFLQVCKQLYALTDLGPEDWADLNALREAMGIMQHHDAVTGTEKEHVAHDYERILSLGFEECGFVAAMALSKIVTKNSEVAQVRDPAPEIPFNSCLLANISQCETTEKSDRFIVTVYNPLSRPVDHYVRLPVPGSNYKVTDPEGNNLVVDAIPIPAPVLKIPGRSSSATHEIVFLASKLPPLGFQSYFVERSSQSVLVHPTTIIEDALKGFNIAVKVDATGLLKAIRLNGKTIPLTQNYLYYRGTVGDNIRERSSGAYIFRPNGTDAYPILKHNKPPTVTYYSGKTVDEIHQTFSDWVSQVVRVYKSEDVVEFNWLVGPIPVDDVNGKEIISRFDTKLESHSIFYTDSNGREVLKRVRNFRPTFKLIVTEPVASNYYPVTSKILIRDPNQDLEVAILNDRAQGGTSLKDGEIELMIHRNCRHDDAFGVNEALNEQAYGVGLVARGSHYLVVGPYLKTTDAKSIAAKERDLAQRKILGAWTFVSPTNASSFNEYKKKYKTQYSGLTRSLPDNVQILTLEPWIGMNFLLRFEHVLEKNEDPVLSEPVVVDIKGLFSAFEILSYRETTLGANQWLEENQRLKFATGDNMESIVDDYKMGEPVYDHILQKWKIVFDNDTHWHTGLKNWRLSQFETNEIDKDFAATEEATPQHTKQDFKITLNPMQIRTFIIDVKMTTPKGL